MAKGPGSHPHGPGSIPGTEPNWPGQCLTRMLDYLFLSIFLLFSSSMASWKPHLHQGNNCQCWTNALWNVVIILPCLFATQIWVESWILILSQLTTIQFCIAHLNSIPHHLMSQTKFKTIIFHIYGSMMTFHYGRKSEKNYKASKRANFNLRYFIYW